MIDIVIPVYRGEQDVRRCLASIGASTGDTAYEIVVIDDCSPEPALSAWLDALADEGRVTLLRNARNLGFVGTVNRGMDLHPDRDVLLLNSDTEVANDWLDRIVRCAASAPNIATVTPFSNNATICSYPFNGWNGEVPGTLGLAGLDRLFARVNAGGFAELPTGVGFCMFIRRACLDAIGRFDAERFGRGYGEENDFSLRAAKAGWRNLLCADTFVYHHGGVSFGTERVGLMQRGGKVLLELHPDYDERVAAFVAADPAQPFRAAIDAARAECGAAERAALQSEWPDTANEGRRSRRAELAAECAIVNVAPAPHGRIGRPVVLHISHSWGGGVERWTRDFAAADARGWHLLLRSRSGRNDASLRIELMDILGSDVPLLGWDLESPIAFTADRHPEYAGIVDGLVDGFDVEAVVVSSLIGHGLDALRTRRPTLVMLHDFYPFCPALFGWFGKACTSCDRSDLQRCLDSNPLNVFWHHKDVDAWEHLRSAYARCLEAGHVHVAAPGYSVHARYAKLFPVLRTKPWTMVPHGLGVVPERLPLAQGFAARDEPTRRLRVLVPGRLAPHKGLHLLKEILPALQEFCDVLLLGSGEFGEPFAAVEHVGFVRDYANAELAARVAEFRPDCALLLSTLPETFSYTLSEMQALGVPVVATRIGAFAERIEDRHNGFLVAAEPHRIVACLRELAADPSALRRVREALRSLPVRTAARMAAECRDLLGVGENEQPGRRPSALVSTLATALQDARTRGLEAAQRDAARFATELAARRLELDEARQGMEDARQRIARLEHTLRDAQLQRDALLASTSWRITRPLRAATEVLLRRPDSPSARTAASAAPGDAGAKGSTSPACATIAARRADPLNWRRARWLAGELGRELVDADALAPGCIGEGLAFDGISLVLGASTAGVLAPQLVCFEGTGPAMTQPATPLPPSVRLLVPTQALLAGLGQAEQALADRVRVASYPLLGVLDGRPERAIARRRCREELVLPDETRIVLGVGRADARSGLLRFARLALEMTERRTGCCFVWLGGRDDAWVGAHWAELGLPVSLRRLFIIDGDDFERWMQAADAYLGCREDNVYDAGALEALAAGLPVAVETAASLPDALLAPEQAPRLALATGEHALSSLAEWLDGGEMVAPGSAESVRQRFGGKQSIADFMTALSG